MKKAIWVLMVMLALASMSFGQQGCGGVQLSARNRNGSAWSIRNNNTHSITVYFETADGRPAGTRVMGPRGNGIFEGRCSQTPIFPVWCE